MPTRFISARAFVDIARSGHAFIALLQSSESPRRCVRLRLACNLAQSFDQRLAISHRPSGHFLADVRLAWRNIRMRFGSPAARSLILAFGFWDILSETPFSNITFNAMERLTFWLLLSC